MGLSAPVRLTVCCCWSYDNDTRRRVGQRKGVSLAGSHARRDGWMQPTAPAVAFLTLAILMKVAHAADLIIDYLNGSALGESSGYSGDRREWFTALEQHSQDFPVMHSVFNSLETGDTSENGQIELEMILAGIEAVAKR